MTDPKDDANSIQKAVAELAQREQGPKPTRGAMMLELPDYLWARIQVDPDTACWQWLGPLDRHGYGRCYDREEHRTRQLAHRVVYRITYGPIPADLTVDHQCHNQAAAQGKCLGGPACLHRACLNPVHMTLATRRANADNSPTAVSTVNSAKTHCPLGHPYDEDNTYVENRPGARARHCKACNRLAVLRYEGRAS